jgi:hypothetical protein
LDHAMPSRPAQDSPQPLRRFVGRLLVRLIAPTLALLALHAPAQDLSKRLILRDGSYQLCSKYEVKGDRVRYMSAERNEWEELPSALVDWPATEKYEKDRVASAIPEAAAIDEETEADRQAELARLPQVAPGLRLPQDSGIFMLDNFQGQPQLVELQQSEGDINPNLKTNILRGAIPMAGAKQTIELDGEHSFIRAHVAVPSLYINVDAETNNEPPSGETDSAKPSLPSLDAPRTQPQQAQQPEQAIVLFNRFRIVHVKVKDGKRIVGDLKRTAAGKVSQQQDFVKTTIDRVSGGWLKLTPVTDLAPGEYALIEIKGNEGMNLYVWDFAVNANAPANANPYKPEEKKN